MRSIFRILKLPLCPYVVDQSMVEVKCWVGRRRELIIHTLANGHMASRMGTENVRIDGIETIEKVLKVADGGGRDHCAHDFWGLN